MSEETLADILLRDLLRGRKSFASPGDAASRRSETQSLLMQSRRFVLDADMSRFLAHLTLNAFKGPVVRRPERLDSLRHSARLPYPHMWIELDLRALSSELDVLDTTFITNRGDKKVNVLEVCPRVGWLLHEHENEVYMSVIHELTKEFTRSPHNAPAHSPYVMVWSTVDDVKIKVPYGARLDHFSGMIAHGVHGHISEHVGVMYADPDPFSQSEKVLVRTKDRAEWVPRVLVDACGMARYAITLLATLNDIPISVKKVHPHRGFYAKGKMRNYLQHSVLQLNVPSRVSYTRLAARLVAMARRRAHMVRGHWRVYARDAIAVCDDSSHIWGPADEQGRATCKNCTIVRKWIEQHQRGDASLGFVTHTYAVTHPKD